MVAAGSSIYPSNVRVPPGGSAVLCDGLGSGANHVIEGQTSAAMTASTHPATAEEVPGWDEASIVNNGGQWPPMVLNENYDGTVPSSTLDMYSPGPFYFVSSPVIFMH